MGGCGDGGGGGNGIPRFGRYGLGGGRGDGGGGMFDDMALPDMALPNGNGGERQLTSVWVSMVRAKGPSRYRDQRRSG